MSVTFGADSYAAKSGYDLLLQRTHGLRRGLHILAPLRG